MTDMNPINGRAPYVPKTDKELEELAWDIVGGKVFHSLFHLRHLQDRGTTIAHIWMPLAFIDGTMSEWAKDNDIVEVYEYMDKANNMTVNGFPTFMSMHMLSKDDQAKLTIRVVDLVKLRESRLEDTTASITA